MKPRSAPLTRVLIGALLLATSLAAAADDYAVTDMSKGRVSREAVIDALTPQPKLRTIKLLDDSAPQPAPAASFSQIRFAFDSAELTEAAHGVLDTIADALTAPALAGSAFEIQGHTDATGSTAYNEALSLRRARAARDYLVARGGLQPSRLSIAGKGESELLDPRHPASPANRRVQIVNRGS
jgi:outer membrane protein OmpA-like peptidoglycan-associated protein